MGKDQLIYFGVYGRAEPIRMLYALGGVELDDVRLEFSQWPTAKKGKEWASQTPPSSYGIKLWCMREHCSCRFSAEGWSLSGPRRT